MVLPFPICQLLFCFFFSFNTVGGRLEERIKVFRLIKLKLSYLA